MEGPILTAECYSMGSLKGPGGIETGGEPKPQVIQKVNGRAPGTGTLQGWQAVRYQLPFPPSLLMADITS